MGTDIHFYVERRVDGQWVTADTWYDIKGEPGRSVYKWGPDFDRLAGPFYSDRNYDLFAILADVRNGIGFAGVDTGSEVTPIAPPRGVPDDACAEYRAQVDALAHDGHSHSYLTVAELLAYDWTQRKKKRGWVTAKEFVRFALEGKPSAWCSMVDGGGIAHISNEEMRDLVESDARATFDEPLSWRYFHHLSFDAPRELLGLYTYVEWEVYYYECCAKFLAETMPRLWQLGSPSDVRIIFFFDN